MQFEIDEARLSRELAELAGFTHSEASPHGTAVTRIVFTSDDLRARKWLESLALEEDLEVREDAVGNTFMRWAGTDSKLPAIGTGSHIDAIPHSGMFDGTVGVLGGLEAIRALKRSGQRFRRSIELLLLTSEEPTRFGIGCLGSRLISGTLDASQADTMRDTLEVESGNSLKTIRSAAGFHGELASVRLQEGFYHAWLELHIEQGPLLEREGVEIGIVTSIAAPAGYRIVIQGLGGHAGALLMPDRHDALCAAAEIILSIERHTLAANAASGTSDTVATVGTCNVFPGAVNSVPSRVVLQIDIRDTDPARREAVMKHVRHDYAEMAGRRQITIEEQLVNADAPAQSSSHIVELLDEICIELGISAKKMVSRAYHDSLFMARIAPMAMIFVPCRGGISHRPEEFASSNDIARGALVLAHGLAKLASE